MLMPNQYFEIKIIKSNIEHYHSLGYNIQLKDVISVPAEHLTKGSHQNVQVECDFCKKIVLKEFRAYLRDHEYDLDSCTKCMHEKQKITLYNKYGIYNAMDLPDSKEKIKNTVLKKYGTEHYSQTEEFKAKFKATSLARYGVEHPSQSNKIKEKVKNTNLNKFGYICPTGNTEVREKIKNTLLEHYGVEYISQAEEIKEKIKQTNIKKLGVENVSQSEIIKQKKKDTLLQHYGYEYVLQVPELQEKVFETMRKNGTVPTSAQQIELHNMIVSKYEEAEINYPFSKCCLDIFVCIDNIKIDIDYDGWYWHQEGFKDVKRDKFLQQNGFKILRIKSGNKLPTKEQLFESIDKLINTDRKYAEIVLDDWKTTEKEGEKSA